MDINSLSFPGLAGWIIWWCLFGMLSIWLCAWALYAVRTRKTTDSNTVTQAPLVTDPPHEDPLITTQPPLTSIQLHQPTVLSPPPVEPTPAKTEPLVIERVIDNPALIARIHSLEAQVATIPGLKARIAKLEADLQAKQVAPPNSESISPHETGPHEREPYDLRLQAKRQAALKRPALAQSESAQLPLLPDDFGLDPESAKAAGFDQAQDDNLELIEGIGPRVATLLQQAGIRSVSQLAVTPVSKLQEVLDQGGFIFRLADPSTWSQQAQLAVANRWEELRRLQKSMREVAGSTPTKP